MTGFYLISIILGVSFQSIAKKAFTKKTLGKDVFFFSFLTSLAAMVFFLVTSILFCGIFYASPLLLNITDIPWILLIFASFFVTISAYTKIKDKLYSTKCKIKIDYNKKSVTIYAMIDTGNALRDPVSDMPVLVIDEKILKALFSESVTRNNLCEFVEPEDFRIIPYKTISNSGITYGFIPQKLLIEDKVIKDTIIETYPNTIVAPFIMLGGTDGRHYNEISDCVIRFTPVKLTNEDRAGVHGLNEKIKVESLEKELKTKDTTLNSGKLQ